MLNRKEKEELEKSKGKKTSHSQLPVPHPKNRFEELRIVATARMTGNLESTPLMPL